jgi:LysM repeat protein
VTGRSPARLLAPLALVVAAIALFAVVTSGGGDGGSDTSSSPAATATATPASTKKKPAAKKATRTYTIKPGDTPSAIAEANDVDLDALLAANPDVDPGALSVGDKLKIP